MMLNTVTIMASGLTQLYIDPGSGTFLVQLVVAALLGAGIAASNFWKKTFGRISHLFRDRENQERAPDDEQS